MRVFSLFNGACVGEMPFVGAVHGFFLEASKDDAFTDSNVLDGFHVSVPKSDGVGVAVMCFKDNGGGEAEVAVVFEEGFGGLSGEEDAGEAEVIVLGWVWRGGCVVGFEEAPASEVEFDALVGGFGVAVDDADVSAGFDVFGFELVDVVVPEDETAGAGVVCDVEVDDFTGGAVFFAEGFEVGDGVDGGVDGGVGAFFEVADVGDALGVASEFVDDEECDGVFVEEALVVGVAFGDFFGELCFSA